MASHITCNQEIGIGIDLGTCNSCVSLYSADKHIIVLDDLGNNIIPTSILFLEDEILFGETANILGTRYPKNLIKDVKRIIGKTTLKDVEYYNKQHLYDIVEENDNISICITHESHTIKLTPEEIMGLYFSFLRKQISKYITIPVNATINAVCTIPANFTENQRLATIRAAQIAKINVIRLINEPTAAALTYLHEYNKKSGNDINKFANLIIFDMGGGTLDVTLLNVNESQNNEDKLVQVIGTVGDPHLGGNDFNKEIMLYFLKEIKKINPSLVIQEIVQNTRIIQKIMYACEKSKIELSTQINSTIFVEEILGRDYNIQISRNMFENLCTKYFDKCVKLIEQVLVDCSLEIDKISEIILVGGPSSMPKLTNILHDKFKVVPKTLNNPKYSVCVGGALHCYNLLNTDNKLSSDLLVIDVTPMKLGVAIGENMCTIIEKNSKIPCSVTKVFSTEIDNQRIVTIKVYQGNSEFIKNNKLVGKLRLSNIPAMLRRIPKILVKFSMDCSGTLTVMAKELVSGLIVSAVFDNKKYNIPEYDEFTNTDNVLLFRSCHQRKIINEYISAMNKYLVDDQYRMSITKEQKIKLVNLLNELKENTKVNIIDTGSMNMIDGVLELYKGIINDVINENKILIN